MAKSAEFFEQYGLRFPSNWSVGDRELHCFARNWTEDQGGLGRYGHLRNAIDFIWNLPRALECERRKIVYDPEIHAAFIWNEWTEQMMNAFCEEREVVVTGPGSSWKSTTAAMFFLCYWLSDPMRTRVIITSTTLDGLRSRVWKEITHFYRTISSVGNLVQSRTMIQTVKGDDGAGLFGIGVESDGNVEKAAGKIIGRHSPNMGVMIDEMPTVNAAIVSACVNLEKGAERFCAIGVGNATSRFDEHGKMAEPENGWDSVTDRTHVWRTKRGGLCIHLDGRESPKIRKPDKFPLLINQDNLDRSATRDGEDSPKYWQQSIGFWPPEGITKTVLSETMIIKFRAKEKPIWVGEFKEGAGLDPAFEGGDRCILRIGRIGKIDVSDGRGGYLTGFDPSHAIIPIKLSVTSKEPIHYQIVRLVKNECETRGIPREMFALDTTGEGGGLASIFSREWGPGFHEVEFGGRASEEPVSENNPTPASKEYLYKVTELWMNFRVMVQNGQVRNLDDETAIEFCKRYYEMVGNLMKLESKAQMKLRTGRSPDYADATVVLADLFRKRTGFITSGTPRHTDEQWKAIAKKFDARNKSLNLAA